MIPVALSQEALSLKQGCDRPAISLLAVLDSYGNLLESRFCAEPRPGGKTMDL